MGRCQNVLHIRAVRRRLLPSFVFMLANNEIVMNEMER
jgi:hypothetical protein